MNAMSQQLINLIILHELNQIPEKGRSFLDEHYIGLAKTGFYHIDFVLLSVPPFLQKPQHNLSMVRGVGNENIKQRFCL